MLIVRTAELWPGNDLCGNRGPKVRNEGVHTGEREQRERVCSVRSASEAAPQSWEAPGSQAKARVLSPGEQTHTAQ